MPEADWARPLKPWQRKGLIALLPLTLTLLVFGAIGLFVLMGVLRALT